ncbi:Endoglucanase gh5-1 [Pyricularia oryzae]
MKSIFALGALISAAAAQAPAWAQCGGNGHTGPTTCVSGHSCVVVNGWYHQCQPGASNPPGNGGGSPGGGGGNGKFIFFGTNEAGAEFGQDTLPGVWGKEYTFPEPSTIDTLMSQGYNTFRVCMAMERLADKGLTGAFNQAYLRNLTTVVNHITNKGGWAVIDPHNYGRYNKAIITDTSAFRTFFVNLGTAFKSNSKVVFDTNNEYNTMDQNLVLRLNQASIDGIRAAGATSQYIFVEGNAWSGAWSWNTTNDNMKALTDPQNKLVYEMHQYLDSDSSGTSPDCVSANIGVQRIVGATEWLRANKKVGMIGEFAGGPNEQCKAAVKGMLDHMKQNSDVWLGALWWAAGPWWGDYMYGFEPPSSTAYVYYNSLLKTYL